MWERTTDWIEFIVVLSLYEVLHTNGHLARDQTVSAAPQLLLYYSTLIRTVNGHDWSSFDGCGERFYVMWGLGE